MIERPRSKKSSKENSNFKMVQTKLITKSVQEKTESSNELFPILAEESQYSFD